MAEQTNRNVPRIRFKGYVGEWEEKTLGELTPLRGGFAFKSIQFRKSGIPIVKISNVLPSGEVGGVFAFYDEQANDQNFSLPNNAALLAMSGATTGKVSILEKQNSEKFYQNQRVGYFEDLATADYSFISTFVRSQFFTKQLEAVLVAGAQPNVSSKEINSFDLLTPIHPEQKQIGGYFREVDRLIGLQQRKHDKLVTLKKAMLQKMFPQPGTPTPEIRFKGFSGNWKEKKLAELCDLFTDGDWIESKDQSANGIRLLQTGNVGINKFVDKAGKARWISEDTFGRLKCEEVFSGDILISRLPDPAGRACVVPKLSHRVITAVDCTIIRTAKTCGASFLVQHFSLASYFDTVNNYLGGGTRQRISRSALGKFTIQLPSFAEQQKIGHYFRTLDSLISKHAVQLAKLKQLKSACLEQMFV